MVKWRCRNEVGVERGGFSVGYKFGGYLLIKFMGLNEIIE